jgi:voltage-gated potassium channel Kch
MRTPPRERRHRLSRFLGFWTEERSLTVMLILVVLHFFVLSPVNVLGRAFHLVAAFFLSLALLAGVLSLERKMMRRLGVLLVAGVIVFRTVAAIIDAAWLLIGDTLFTLCSLAALILIVFRQVSQEGPVSAHLIRGAIALYLLIAILFAFLYGLAEQLSPGAFNIPGSALSEMARGEAFYYFSVVTLTTVGYGDITAVHPFVRSLVMLEALIGQLYPAILIARLVTLELETRRSGTGK